MCAQSPPTREDEMGTPYHIIVDEKTLETGIVALQDRDTTAVVGCYTKYTTSVMCIHINNLIILSIVDTVCISSHL